MIDAKGWWRRAPGRAGLKIVDHDAGVRLYKGSTLGKLA